MDEIQVLQSYITTYVIRLDIEGIQEYEERIHISCFLFREQEDISRSLLEE